MHVTQSIYRGQSPDFCYAWFLLLCTFCSLLLASNTAVRVEPLARLTTKLALGNQLIQELDRRNQVVVNLALLAPAIDNELHGV
jgi:hypothetical protein